ncbi:MAG: FecR domain-containing protein [Sphingobacteriaceae bacterium]|nr:FecR domain-containing protein [Cytophagaceae bacterium]
MDESPPWELLAKALAGEASPDEQRRVADWLAQNPENPAIFTQLQAAWKPDPTHASSPETEAAFSRLLSRLDAEDAPQTARPVRRLGWVRWAAAVALLLGTWTVWQTVSTSPDEPVAKVNPKGERSVLKLSDGSTVWLNADSRLEFPETFSDSIREVRLVGEAFFKVAHNPRQPFIVRLATGSVRVLGTSFNIRSYPGDSTVETTVLTGKVAFVPKTSRSNQSVSQKDTVLVLPNSRVIQSLVRAEVRQQPVAAALSTAWTDDRIEFRDTPLGEVAKTLERWYGTPVVLARADLAQCPLTGSFRRQSLREVMDVIALTRVFDYELSGERLLIKGRGCQ